MAMKQKNDAMLYYLATMRPVDDEDASRILRHREERVDWGFTTIECPENILEHTRVIQKNDSVLLDSTTALLSNEMFLPDGCINKNADVKIIGELTELVNRLDNIVIVSDYIFGEYMGAYDELTVMYCKQLANIDIHMANICDTVLEVCYGQQTFHKGGFSWI